MSVRLEAGVSNNKNSRNRSRSSAASMHGVCVHGLTSEAGRWNFWEGGTAQLLVHILHFRPVEEEMV
jgi:hypothetical protein